MCTWVFIVIYYYQCLINMHQLQVPCHIIINLSPFMCRPRRGTFPLPTLISLCLTFLQSDHSTILKLNTCVISCYEWINIFEVLNIQRVNQINNEKTPKTLLFFRIMLIVSEKWVSQSQANCPWLVHAFRFQSRYIYMLPYSSVQLKLRTLAS
jgi:hypothetical protein